MPIDILNYIWQELQHGNISVIFNLSERSVINEQALRILNVDPSHMTVDDIAILDLLVKICNIVYNNSETPSPLEDGIYDRLMVRYRGIVPEGYQVGAPVVLFNEEQIAEMDKLDNLKCPIITEPKECRDGLFHQNFRAEPPIMVDYDPTPVDRSVYKKQTHQNIVVPHKYPKLVGTLDKCKFTLNKEAIELGCFDDPDITIFERDFLGAHIAKGIINQYEPFTLILELKYDGMSVEADVTNRILSARSRGDTNQDLAEDLSVVLGDYVFPRAPEITRNEAFGMKFECIISKSNLARLGSLRGKEYKNGRNGLIGLMKSLDAYAYRDLITLVPLETSLDIDPITEIEFMNKYFTTDVYMKYAVVTGTYNEVLFQVYRFVKEAEQMRPYLPFMYDGVVVHYYDQRIRDMLGRVNSVNKYSVAIKFNPLKVETVFTGYDFTVGQNGVVTPMIHYMPVEFLGTIHTKSSGHSLQRFNELNLAVGDTIEVEYRNDVMPYVVRRVEDAHSKYSNLGERRPIEFPMICPSCGQRLSVYDSGKSVVCTNYSCRDRVLARIVNMMKKLNIKGFADSSLKKLNVQSLTDLLSIVNNPKRAYDALGEVSGNKFIQALNNFMTIPIDDYRVIGSIGFTNIAIETWKKILFRITPDRIVYSSDAELHQELSFIRGIGDVTAYTIIKERQFFAKDILTLMSLKNVRKTYGIKKKTIRYTGCRPDDELTAYLEAQGFDANPNAGVTRTTDILIVPEVGHDSSKVRKCGPNTKIIAIDEFKRHVDYYLYNG